MTRARGTLTRGDVMWYGMNGGWAWGIFGLLFALLLIAAIVVLVLVAIRMIRGLGQQGQQQSGWTTGGGPGQGAGPGGVTPARRILDERFARGEIGLEEYHERRRHLDG
ncbi:SHOCT domain-containing protein [Georgenia sp. AZ-5]|uniref:SHOCT domain-containing protein n=1 Tax=Georgenia sp. AZ-5 TaxID=3367526 RepID=UPI0037547A89